MLCKDIRYCAIPGMHEKCFNSVCDPNCFNSVCLLFWSVVSTLRVTQLARTMPHEAKVSSLNLSIPISLVLKLIKRICLIYLRD